MLGQTLSVVTLNESGKALSGNYLRVDLARTVEPNRLMDVEIGAVTESGLSETAPFPELAIFGYQ